MGHLKGFANVVFPARDLEAGIAAWRAVLDEEPAFQGPDFAVFTGGGAEIGLSAAPWVDHPLVFWRVEDVNEAHGALLAAGATPLGEIGDGSLAELGSAEITNGDPATGVVDVPGGRLAVLRAADGNLIGLHQELAPDGRSWGLSTLGGDAVEDLVAGVQHHRLRHLHGRDDPAASLLRALVPCACEPPRLARRCDDEPDGRVGGPAGA